MEKDGIELAAEEANPPHRRSRGRKGRDPQPGRRGERGGNPSAESSLAELTARLGASVRVRSPQAAELRERLAGAGIESHGIDSTLLVRGTTLERVGEIAAASQIVLHELVAESSSLEEVFLELTHGEKS